jgi:transcriptional regulator with XRE-family HTH domain
MSLSPPSPDDLRAFRKAMGGWSQAQLATALGASTRGVEEWEAGRREPPAFLGLALAALNAGIAQAPLETYETRGLRELLREVNQRRPGAMRDVETLFTMALSADRDELRRLLRAFADEADERDRKGP